MSAFLLEVISQQRSVFSEEVESIVVPTVNGACGILPRHVPLFTSLAEGEIKITTAKREYYLAIGGGFMEVGKNRIQILVSRAYHADELNEAEIKKAQSAAREILAKKAEEKERQEAYAMLRRSILELKVISHRKKTVDFRPSISSFTKQN